MGAAATDEEEGGRRLRRGNAVVFGEVGSPPRPSRPHTIAPLLARLARHLRSIPLPSTASSATVTRPNR